jgi:hypothetical protein
MEMGTEILLARMKEYPEEFINTKNIALGLNDLRWDKVLREGREYLPKEDVEALEAGIKQLYIDRFNERVLKTLAGESEPEQTEGTIKYKAQGRYGQITPMSDPRALFGNPQADAHQEYMNEMARQQDLMNQMEMQQQRQMMNSKNQVNTGGMSSLKNFFSRGT